MKIMIATPAYGGKVDVSYSIALADTVHELMSTGIQVVFNIPRSGSLLVAERNRILKNFMDSDCSHLLCVDGDLAWPAKSVLSMIHKNKEFVGGVYPCRGEASFTFRPVLNEDQSIVTESNLLKMEYIPAGFMLLQKSMLEKMKTKFPQLYFEPKHESMKINNGWAFFNTEIWDGEFWGEDYYFCRKAREAGVDIWVDPMITFNHAGVIGALIQVLTDNKDGTMQPKEQA